MIKKLIIENFQSHEKTELNLDPGVNIITGVSLSGKTAILRALYWLLYNRPSGDKFRSKFAVGSTKVMIETTEGDQIWHVKDEKVNSYAMGDNVFDKIGKEIPDMVQRALRVSELNVQKQLDEPFLITSSAGEVAKTINRITRLEMVDNWVTDLTQTINSINREKERLETDIEASGEKIKAYRVLADVQPLLDKGAEIERNLKALQDKKNKIKDLTWSLRKNSDLVTKLKQGLAVKSLIQQIEGIAQEVEKRSERAKVARSTLRAYRSTQRLKSAIEPIKKLVELEESRALLVKKAEIIKQAQNQYNFYMTAQKYHDSVKSLFKENLKQFKVCPTCNQTISNRVVNSILGET